MLRRVRWLLHEFGAAAWDVIKLPFWLIGQGFGRVKTMGWRRITILVVAAGIVTVVATGALIKATSQPGFCKSCHVMRPYFEAWQTSTHSHIECTTCHVPPGLEGTLHHKFQALSMVANYFTGLYKRSKPWAEVEDTACLREGCHDSRLLKGTEDFKGVKFDHTPHLTQPRRDRELRCTSCHAQIVQGEHITVTETTCFLCHFKPDMVGHQPELAQCTHCHQPPTGNAAADSSFDHSNVLESGIACQNCHAGAVAGDGYVPPDRCNSCHAQKEHIEKYDDLEFVHRMHVTDHKVECLHCHIAIRHGKEALGEDDPDQECAKCHAAQAKVWEGKVPNIPSVPSKMARVGMTCSSCHAGDVHEAGKAKPKPVCVPCHEAGYDGLWTKWREPLNKSVEAMTARANVLIEPYRSQMLEALAVYRKGGPVHDPDLALTLNELISGNVETGGGSCMSCHPAADVGTPLWDGKPVPHRKHAEKGLTCESCHQTDSKHHGKLTLTLNECNACHHKAGEQAACHTCHNYQKQVYAGTLQGVKAEASSMALAEVECTQCHAAAPGKISRNTAAGCTGCHEASYGDTLRVWTAQGDDLLRRTTTMMSRLNRESDVYRDYQDLAAALKRDGSRGVHNGPLFRDWMKRIESTP